jgi:hypothetical protein
MSKVRHIQNLSFEIFVHKTHFYVLLFPLTFILMHYTRLGYSRLYIDIYTVSLRMNAHILNFLVHKINRVRWVRFSPLDSGNIKVLRTIFVVWSAYDCAHASVSGHMNTGQTLCKQQRELKSKCREMEEGGGTSFPSSCFMCWNLYSPIPLYFLNKNVRIVTTRTLSSLQSSEHKFNRELFLKLKNMSLEIKIAIKLHHLKLILSGMMG